MSNKDYEALIKKEELKSLSGEDIMKLVKHKTHVVTYPNLIKYKHIDDLLGKYGCCVILYQTSPNYGHWVCVFKENKDTIQHFDSYGLKPDMELDFIDTHFRKNNNEYLPHLTYLLYHSGYKITYNEYKLQSKDKKISTCGRWVSARLIFRDMPLKKFVDMFKEYNNYNPDFIVTFFTLML